MVLDSVLSTSLIAISYGGFSQDPIFQAIQLLDYARGRIKATHCTLATGMYDPSPVLMTSVSARRRNVPPEFKCP